MHPRTLFLLGRIGLSEVEMEHLNVGPILRIPHDPNGYGLIGGTGTGKTCHLAWGLAQVVEGIQNS